MDIHLVRRKSEIPHRQIQLRISAMNQCLQPTRVLLTFSKTTANDRHMIAFLEVQQWNGLRVPGKTALKGEA